MPSLGAETTTGIFPYDTNTITTDQGTVLESGTAVETAEGSGRWVYTATTNVPGETNIVVNVVATDRPGGTAVKTQNVNF